MWKIRSWSFWKYQVSRWKCLEESFSNCWEFQLWSLKNCVEESYLIHWKFEVCGRKVFELLNVSNFKCVRESFFPLLQLSSEISSLCNKRFASVKSFFFKFMWGVKDFFQSIQSFEKNVYCSICVQNVFFSNGVLKTRWIKW